MEPSPHFLLLAATLLDEISPDSVPDVALTRLHAVFGPMLTSALQLVDRREVVKVNVSGRHLFQVSSSTGVPYTLFLDLPSGPDARTKQSVLPPEQDESAEGHEGEVEPTSSTTPPHSYAHARIQADAARLAHMYCPCAGYAFNALCGRHLVCKHILAILLAHRLGRLVDTRVDVSSAPTLLGLKGPLST